MSLSNVSNENIVEKLSDQVFSQIKEYILKGYLEKKVYIKPKKRLPLSKSFRNLESWEIFAQRKEEVLKHINSTRLEESGLILSDIILGWEIFNNNKIFHSFTFKVKVYPIAITY